MKSSFNLDYLNEIGSGNNEFIKSVINLFLESTPVQMNNLALGIQDKNFVVIKANAHKLKSSFRAVGAEKSADIVADIEAASMDNNIAIINDVFRELEINFKELTNSLSQHIANS